MLTHFRQCDWAYLGLFVPSLTACTSSDSDVTLEIMASLLEHCSQSWGTEFLMRTPVLDRYNSCNFSTQRKVTTWFRDLGTTGPRLPDGAFHPSAAGTKTWRMQGWHPKNGLCCWNSTLGWWLPWVMSWMNWSSYILERFPRIGSGWCDTEFVLCACWRYLCVRSALIYGTDLPSTRLYCNRSAWNENRWMQLTKDAMCQQWFTASSFEIVVEGQCIRNVPAETIDPKA